MTNVTDRVTFKSRYFPLFDDLMGGTTTTYTLFLAYFLYGETVIGDVSSPLSASGWQ
jgi:hypothetical protein